VPLESSPPSFSSPAPLVHSHWNLPHLLTRTWSDLGLQESSCPFSLLYIYICKYTYV
jgi:hypothetical protein